MPTRVVIALVLAVAAAFTAHAVAPAVHQVRIGTDGTFSPASLTIRRGDTVEWQLSSRRQAVVAAAGPAPSTGVCPVPRAFATSDGTLVAAPLPFAPSGIFSLAPLEDSGLAVNAGRCPGGRGLTIDGRTLCANGPPLTTMEETWADESNTGVFIRLLWNMVQKAPGTDDANFDFSDLDREVSQAVRHGKLYSLAIKAGQEGTPDWIFSTDRNGRPRAGNGGGVTRLTLQDQGSGPERRTDSCGPRMDLGSPTDEAFEARYFAMLAKVAAHLRARADWYRALAYIKPSGANLFSHENRLPKRCDAGCICNSQVFAEHGYRPSRLYGFYKRQFALLEKEFPGKAISYQLIQDGFPLVNESGGYERPDGSPSNGRPLPGGSEQTSTIIEMGKEKLGRLFVVQHNGLQVYRGECTAAAGAGRGRGRRGGGRGAVAVGRGPGCPNPWVLGAGADGKTITGFQTQNLGEISRPEDVDLALRNAWDNSDASFVELYEAQLWPSVHANGGRLPSGRTIAAWADLFHDRRRKDFSEMGDPFPVTVRQTFTSSASGSLTYFEPATCRVGTITIAQ